ncbi:ubiquitin C-terminal hydrolase 12 [Arachis duranensis]|uniref:Ubiquitin C-terminal hydrolase 12 n=1 Tax=Arachis duranensis TaxID=130453 RepID=A0A9C6TAB5_ARADU|nr:ubiquitin C-terminal hydrolase 12 [Arachis duranensis]
MENQEKIGETFETFKWTIKDLSKLNTKNIYSQDFFIGGHPWVILMYLSGNNVDYLSIYLGVRDSSTLTDGWTRFSKFRLVLINQINNKLTTAKETEHTFSARDCVRGFKLCILLSDFYDHSKGFLVNGTCIIEAKISVNIPELEKKVYQAAPPVPCKFLPSLLKMVIILYLWTCLQSQWMSLLISGVLGK